MIKTSHRQYFIKEGIAAFYAVELINMVYRLHQCHVIHGVLLEYTLLQNEIKMVTVLLEYIDLFGIGFL